MGDYYGSFGAHMRSLDRQWRLGYEAGLRHRRQLVVVAVALLAMAVLRRHMHPAIALIWLAMFVLAIAPLLVVLLVVGYAMRVHRQARSRTLGMGGGAPGVGADQPPGWIPDPDSLFDSYRVLSTSRWRHTETRRYTDGSIWTINTRTGEKHRDS